MGAEGLASLVNMVTGEIHIAEKYYNKDDLLNYHPLLFSIFGGNFNGSPNNLEYIEFAYLCGLINGIGEEIDATAEIIPLLADYICDPNVRSQINDAISDLSFADIWNNIETTVQESFSGNQYLDAEQAGVYTINALSVVIPLSKVSWVSKAKTLVNTVRTLPKHLIYKFDRLKSSLVANFKLVREDAQAQFNNLVFVASNETEDIARFVDDGLMTVNQGKWAEDVTELILVEELGELSYKVGDNGILMTDDIALYKTVDGLDARVGRVANAGATGIKVIDDFLALAPKIDNIAPNSLPTGYQIVNKNGSKYIRRLDASDVNTPRLMVDEAGTIVPYVKPQRLSSNATLRNRLIQENGGVIPPNHQAHHIIPDNVVQNSAVHQEAINRGLYDIDRTSNGKLLAEADEDWLPISEAYPTHFGSHPNYDGDIVNAIDDVLDLNNVLPSQIGGLSDSKLLEIIDDIEGEALGILEDWVPSKLN